MFILQLKGNWWVLDDNFILYVLLLVVTKFRFSKYIYKQISNV